MNPSSNTFRQLMRKESSSSSFFLPAASSQDFGSEGDWTASCSGKLTGPDLILFGGQHLWLYCFRMFWESWPLENDMSFVEICEDPWPKYELHILCFPWPLSFLACAVAGKSSCESCAAHQDLTRANDWYEIELSQSMSPWYIWYVWITMFPNACHKSSKCTGPMNWSSWH